MDRTGLVREIKGKKAVVRFVRSDACGHCNACFSFGSNEADIEIDNTKNAKVGDTVEIELHGKAVFKASVVVYGIPVAALIAGAALGSAFGDLYTALGGLLFAAGSFFILRALEPRFSRMNEFKPRMISVVQPQQINEEGENENEQ